MTRPSGRVGAGRRVGRSLAVYLPLAALCWWGVPWLRELLLLPTLFVQVARGALVSGTALVAVLAWRYPDVGGDGGHGSHAAEEEG